MAARMGAVIVDLLPAYSGLGTDGSFFELKLRGG
jgi:hypothetical protein